MPDVEIRYDPAVWAPVAESGGMSVDPEAAATLVRLLVHAPSGGRFLLLAEPVEPPVVVDLSATAVGAATSRAVAEDAFIGAKVGQLEEVELAGGVGAFRYIRFPQVAEFLPGEPGEDVFVAELHYVRVIRGIDTACVLIATVITPRINDLAGIAEHVESLVELATVS